MIKVESLRIDYDDVTAVHDLSLEVSPGEIFGLVGPNGAGKTSTLKALAGILEPTYGDIKISGYDLELAREKALMKVGYMPDFSPVYEHLKVWEYLDVFAAAYHIPASMRLKKIKHWVDKVNLGSKYGAYVRDLSRGMRQRLVLAKTLIPEPDVLLLDEPASGLDPIARKDMRDILKEAALAKKAIIISSHILSELSDFCNAVGIMQKGKLLVSGAIEDIRRRLHSS
ncbi:MAG: ABC transporter ATP-binding protein, partial [Candidatus Omnitrophota bacterium]